jgi:hypothetical protein
MTAQLANGGDIADVVGRDVGDNTEVLRNPPEEHLNSQGQSDRQR